MKYSVSEAARIVGVTRKTFYNHIGEKNISYEKDENGHYKFDGGELLRVYGDDIDLDRAKPKSQQADTTHKETPISTSQKQLLDEISAENAELKKKVQDLEKENAVKDKEIYGNEALLEERKATIEALNQALSKAQDITKLIEDKREEQGAADWKKEFDALQREVANTQPQDIQKLISEAIKEDREQKAKRLAEKRQKQKRQAQAEYEAMSWLGKRSKEGQQLKRMIDGV